MMIRSRVRLLDRRLRPSRHHCRGGDWPDYEPCVSARPADRIQRPVVTSDFIASLDLDKSSFRLMRQGRGRISAMGDAELPEHVRQALEESLPEDLNDLLDDVQKSRLNADLAKNARLRREAEIQSATLRMA